MERIIKLFTLLLLPLFFAGCSVSQFSSSKPDGIYAQPGEETDQAWTSNAEHYSYNNDSRHKKDAHRYTQNPYSEDQYEKDRRSRDKAKNYEKEETNPPADNYDNNNSTYNYNYNYYDYKYSNRIGRFNRNFGATGYYDSWYNPYTGWYEPTYSRYSGYYDPFHSYYDPYYYDPYHHR